MDLSVADNAKLPFTKINRTQIDCNFEGMSYFLKASKGFFGKSDGNSVVKIYPEKNALILNLSDVAGLK
jgi:hypothetical protein